MIFSKTALKIFFLIGLYINKGHKLEVVYKFKSDLNQEIGGKLVMSRNKYFNRSYLVYTKSQNFGIQIYLKAERSTSRFWLNRRNGS